MNTRNIRPALASLHMTSFLPDSGKADAPKYEWIRLRFETQNIAPSDFPRFKYVASVLGHNSMQYTALIPDSTLEGAIMAVKVAWSDAIIHAAEINNGQFIPNDLALKPPVYGVASDALQSKPGLFRRIWIYCVGTPAATVGQMRQAHEENQQHQVLNGRGE